MNADPTSAAEQLDASLDRCDPIEPSKLNTRGVEKAMDDIGAAITAGSLRVTTTMPRRSFRRPRGDRVDRRAPWMVRRERVLLVGAGLAPGRSQRGCRNRLPGRPDDLRGTRMERGHGRGSASRRIGSGRPGLDVLVVRMDAA